MLGSQTDFSGLAVPLSRPSSLRLTVGNKPGRASLFLLDSLCKADAATRRDLSFVATSILLRGYIMVKCCEPLAICCPRHCSRAGGGGIAEKIKFLVSCKPPRTVSYSTSEEPILIFTDSAFRHDLATMPAAVFFP